jgi:branched-chain amino acid transport system substrate-binding protein
MTMSSDAHAGAIARPRFWREARIAALALAALLLAACSTGNLGTLFKDEEGTQPRPAVPDIEAGGPKVALLLPLSMGGEMQNTARALKQAAELALLDNPGAGIVLITKDSGGTDSGAQAAAQAAINEGAQLILGPLLANEVSAVSPIARSAGVNVIAFSSANSVAGNGTFLMSFPPEDQIAKVVQYAAANGYSTISAMYPKDRFGQAIEQALVNSAGRSGATVGTTERYAVESVAARQAADRIAPRLRSAGGGQALILPQGGQILGIIGDALLRGGVSPGNVKFLGTGQWDDGATAQVPAARGGWFAGVPPELTQRFASKYQSNYGSKPPRIASLAYDAVSMAIQLNHSGGLLP